MRSGSLALLLVGLSLIPCVSLSSLAFTGDVVLLTKLKTPTHHLCRGKQISSQHRRGLIIPAVSAAPSALRTPGKASPFCISAHGDSSGGEPVEVGDVVRLHYLGDLEDGDEFDSTFERDPIEFEVGSGRVIRGIDAAVIGMRVGELKDVMVPCEEAFGLRRESRLLNISKANLPPGPYPGQLLGIKGVPGVVTHVWDGLPIVEVDANHPLAGEDLYVTLKLVGLVKGRELTSATFAGGPFWGLELVFQRVPGVLSTQSGYTQGHKPYPTYSEVQTGRTGHTEAVLVTYDSRVCSYHNLLEAYFSSVDVTTIDKQRSNYGPMYRSAIYWHTEEQREMALVAMTEAEAILKEIKGPDSVGEGPGGQHVVMELEPNTTFWRAEERHQQFLEKLGQPAGKGATDPVVCFTDSGGGVVEPERPEGFVAPGTSDRWIQDFDDDVLP